MNRVLIRNYFDLNGSFDGFEKTIVADEVASITDNKMQIMYRELGYSSKVGFTDRVKTAPKKLTKAMKETAILTARYLVSDTSCMYEYDGKVVNARTLTWVSKPGKADYREIVMNKFDELEIRKGDNIFRSGNVIVTPVEKRALKDTVTDLVRCAERAQNIGEGPVGVIIALYKAKADLNNLRALVTRYGFTMAELMSVMDISLPNFVACKKQFDRTFFIAYNDQTVELDLDGKARAYNTKEYMEAIMVEQSRKKIMTGVLSGIDAFGGA